MQLNPWTFSARWKSIVSGGDFKTYVGLLVDTTENMPSPYRITQLVTDDSTTYYNLTFEQVVGRIKQDGQSYSPEKYQTIKGYTAITAPVISRSLYTDKKQIVGNCIASTMQVTIQTTDTIPKSAEIIPMYRVGNDTETSEWHVLGVYWVNKRKVNDDLITLECFDGMKRYNAAFHMNAHISPPHTISEYLQYGGTGDDTQHTYFDIDSRHVPWSSTDIYGSIMTAEVCAQPAVNGLSYIAGLLGGNWTIDRWGKLRLVTIVDPPEETNYVVTDEYDRLWAESLEGSEVVLDGYFSWTLPNGVNGETNDTYGSMRNVYAVTGTLETSDVFTISRVTATFGEEKYTFGDDSGVEVVVPDNPLLNVSFTNTLYDMLVGKKIVAYSASSAIYDPAAELGDWIVIGDKVRSVLYTETLKYDIQITSDISVPGWNEADDEYPFKTLAEKIVTVGSMTYSRTAIEDMIANAILAAHPVGSIYESTDPTDPGDLFGGTWARFGNGRVLVGYGTGTDDNNVSMSFAAGDRAGEYEHTLTVDEIPAHSHSYNRELSSGSSSGVASARYSGNRASQNTGSTGGGLAHNIMQPYVVVYRWQRTA